MFHAVIRLRLRCVAVTTTLKEQKPVYTYSFLTEGLGELTTPGMLETSSARDDLFEIGKEYHMDVYTNAVTA